MKRNGKRKAAGLIFLHGSGTLKVLMIEETIGEIRGRIEKTDALTSEHKAELLQLLETLKSEVSTLSRTHADDAQSIAAFAELSTHEATRAERNPELLELSLEGLSSSVTRFEGSHPRLVQIVNSICTTLANL